jgi:hypothetical protein
MLTTKDIEIHGSKYPVRYDINAFAEYEELTGKSFASILSPMDMKSLRALAFVGLKYGHSHAHNKVTKLDKSIDDIGTWLPINKLTDFRNIATDFIVGEEKKEDTESKPAEDPGE